MVVKVSRMKKLFILLFVLILGSSVLAEPSTDAILQYNEGLDFYKIGQYDKALVNFRKAIDLDPDYVDAYYNLGSVLEYLQQYDAALVVFKQIIVRKPEDYDAVYKAAWLSTQLGDYKKAKTYLGIIPTDSDRFKDAQELASQLKVVLNSAPTEEIKPKSDAMKQTNTIYQNIAGPTGITTDFKGNIYVAGYTDNSILKITPDGKRVVFVKDPRISGPIGLACDKLGNVYIANYNKNNVLKVSTLGQISVLISNVLKPYYLYLDGNLLFISSQGTNSVVKYNLGN